MTRRTAIAAIALLPLIAAADTIYLCKAYNGATFWSKAHCNQHNALVDRIESVADVPFDQQVQQAERGRRPTSQKPMSDYQRENLCDQLYAERRAIEQRYERGYWQDVSTVNQDQARTRALTSQLQVNRCRMQ